MDKPLPKVGAVGCLAACGLAAGAQGQDLAEAPCAVPVFSLDGSFPSGRVGYVLYDDGADCGLRLLATTDGGSHFGFRAPPAKRSRRGPEVSRIVFSSETRGWAFGHSFVATTDGGRSWVREPTEGRVIDLGARGHTVARLDRKCRSRKRCSVTLLA